jgi:outer membrane protein assembly factor BamB
MRSLSRRSILWFLFFAQIGTSPIAFAQARQNADWPGFGWGVASSGVSRARSGIDSRNIGSLQRRQVHMDGIVDASAIYLHGVTVNGSTHDVFFVTTTYGKTIAVDAESAVILWEYTPPQYTSWAGTAQITTSTPVADPDRQHIYAAAPDGTVQKLAIADGHVLWSTAVTLLSQREKIASSLKAFGGKIIAVTGGYIGDAPPYQGHVAVIDAQSGSLLHVWNSLCSDRAQLIDPASCPASGSAIWGRGGAVIDPTTGNIFIATGNGPYDGKTNWGDSVIELNPDATQLLGNYTPADNAELDHSDTDLGSTSPVLLSPATLAQGGKDSLIRLLTMESIAGTAPHTGSESQIVSTPAGNLLFSSPAVWKESGETWVFAADNSGTAAWTFSSGMLTKVWSNSNGGTSPVVAGGLLYIYNPQGGLYVYDPVRGTQVARFETGSGHWNSPIVVDGKIALPEGNANAHATSGVLDIWTLPSEAGRRRRPEIVHR